MVIHILTSLVSLALGAKLLIPRDEARLALVVVLGRNISRNRGR